MEAVRQVGGFDSNFKGVGEDVDIAYRIRQTGWEIHIGTDAVFYEKRNYRLRDLWNHYVWYGYGSYTFIVKNGRAIDIIKLNPISGFLVGIYYSILAYRLIKQKRAFLLPLHYAFKRLAWCYGYLKRQVLEET